MALCRTIPDWCSALDDATEDGWISAEVPGAGSCLVWLFHFSSPPSPTSADVAAWSMRAPTISSPSRRSAELARPDRGRGPDLEDGTGALGEESPISETLDEFQALYGALDGTSCRHADPAGADPETSLTSGARGFSFLLKPCGHVGGDLCGARSAPDTGAWRLRDRRSGHGDHLALMTARFTANLSRESHGAERGDWSPARGGSTGSSRCARTSKWADLLIGALLPNVGRISISPWSTLPADVRTGGSAWCSRAPDPLLLRADGCAVIPRPGRVARGPFLRLPFVGSRHGCFPETGFWSTRTGSPNAGSRRLDAGAEDGARAVWRPRCNPPPRARVLDDLYWHLGNEACPAAGADDESPPCCSNTASRVPAPVRRSGDAGIGQLPAAPSPGRIHPSGIGRFDGGQAGAPGGPGRWCRASSAQMSYSGM